MSISVVRPAERCGLGRPGPLGLGAAEVEAVAVAVDRGEETLGAAHQVQTVLDRG